jgi:hypothetical protein
VKLLKINLKFHLKNFCFVRKITKIYFEEKCKFWQFDSMIWKYFAIKIFLIKGTQSISLRFVVSHDKQPRYENFWWTNQFWWLSHFNQPFLVWIFGDYLNHTFFESIIFPASRKHARRCSVSRKSIKSCLSVTQLLKNSFTTSRQQDSNPLP